jgi:phage tail sheath protein FI
MPALVQVTYPGVYVQEIPSGNVTISGVATSVTAFVGRTVMGPAEPLDCFSFADFERYFGGRALGYPLGYAVEDFFQNGGSHAIIARVFAPTDKDHSGISGATLKIGDTSLKLVAASAGTWGNNIGVSIDNSGITPEVAGRFTRYGLGQGGDAAKAAQTSANDAATRAKAVGDQQDLLAKATSAKNDFDAKAKAATDADQAYITAKAKSDPDPANVDDKNAAAAALSTKTSADAALKSLIDAQQQQLSDKTKEADAAYTKAKQEADAAPDDQAKKKAADDALAGAAAARAADLTAAQTAATSGKGAADIASKKKADDAKAADAEKIKDFFNLTLTYTKPDGQKVIERFAGVTAVDSPAPNRIDRVLAAQSSLARVASDQTWVAKTATQRAPQSTLAKDASGKPLDTPVLFAGGDDGAALTVENLTGDPAERTGIYTLDHVDIFNLMCIPPDPADADYGDLETLYQAAAVYCQKRRAMLIIDPPKSWSGLALQGRFEDMQPTDLGISGPELESRNCAVYFPRIKKLNPETGQIEVFPACGALAGIYATTDDRRGVWKAPAGITAGVGGINSLEFNLTDDQNGMLNPVGINCLRSFPIIGPVVWGARTLRGADLLSDDYKYVPVRRLTLFIEESLYRGTKFAVFEPNDETLWSQLRLSIRAFMADLARQGAFYGYAVACDKNTTTQYDIDRGIVNVRVAFAPVKPAEFIVLQIQQQAGQTVS